ncbi:MAG: YifB family Mg chelatase-like AAA ATPase [Nakamurella sp.]
MAVIGVLGTVVNVEVDIAAGMPGTTVVGMGDMAVAQARDRVRAAVVNSGFQWPQTRITVLLAPAGIHKRGAGFDMAIAAALLAANGTVPRGATAEVVMLGELGLDGTVHPIPGVLPALLAAAQAGKSRAIVAADNLLEASLARGITVRGVRTLTDLVAHFRGNAGHLLVPEPRTAAPSRNEPDLADVFGQAEARFALELAAAGGHHLAMIGPPGAGKTMLAARLPGLLPPLTEDEALEVTAIHSVAGTLDPRMPLLATPPFVDPHHSASIVAMIGGGSGDIRPGSISLAHRGVLFLDEAPEFRRTVLDSLRQPMESGTVLVMRAKHVARFPARFQLVLAANPCPCAAARDIDCVCAAGVRRRYLGRLSGPLMDRVDIRVEVPAVDLVALTQRTAPQESSVAVRERVVEARARAAHRWRQFGYRSNAEASSGDVRQWWRDGGLRPTLLERAVRVGNITARGYDRVLRLALTAADLGERARPDESDVARALALRCGEAA